MKHKKDFDEELDWNIVTWKGVGEVPASEIPCVPVRIDNPYREAFEAGYCEDGTWDGFKGKILKFDRKGIIFQRVLFTTGPYWGSYSEYHEDHVWVFGAKVPKSVKTGDCISFDAEIYLYRRKNGTLDYGLKDFVFREKIESFDVPTEEELEKEHKEHYEQQIRCETCLLYDKCDLMNCLMTVGKEDKIEVEVLLFNVVGNDVIRNYESFSSMRKLVDFVATNFLYAVNTAYDLSKQVEKIDLSFREFIDKKTKLFVIKNKQKFAGIEAFDNILYLDDLLKNDFVCSVYVPVSKQTIGLLVCSKIIYT